MSDTGRLHRDASVLYLRKKQVDRLQREVETLEIENERLRAWVRELKGEASIAADRLEIAAGVCKEWSERLRKLT